MAESGAARRAASRAHAALGYKDGMSKTKTGLMLIASILGLAAVPSELDASPKNISASACNPFNAGQANDIDYLTSGVRTTAAVNRDVVCGVTRDAVAPGANPTVLVGGRDFNGAHTPITLYSYSNTGSFLGSSSGDFTGNFQGQLSIPAAQAPATASFSLIVTLAASTMGNLVYIRSDQ